MRKTIGGFLFIKDGIKYDYCFKETVESLLGFCDQVAVVDAGSTDGTVDVLLSMDDPRLTVNFLTGVEWDTLQGKEKLSYFQDMAAKMLNTDYQFLCQADEIVSEDSHEAIIKAVELGHEGYMCTRINLWGTPYDQLNVPLNRMPCSPEVIRLTKKGYWSYDDGENISAPASFQFVNDIRIFHMGFVRKRSVMKDKIINMQEGVFQVSHDSKLDGMEIFDPYAWFSKEELKPITESLPRVIQAWALERM